MIATADSRVKRIIWIKINSGVKIIINLGPKFPNKVRSKWPAIIFAVNRIVNVIGRIIFLIDSIKIINGIRILGVPWGTKWVNIWLVILIQPNNIILIQRGSVIDKLMIKCLVLVKIYGNNPKKLLIKINVNKVINIKLKLLFFFNNNFKFIK